MTITFNGIPLDVRVPGTYVETDNSQAIQGLLAQPRKALIIGQMTSGGVATEHVPILISQGPQQGDYQFGPGSVLGLACKAFKLANPYTDLWAVPQNDHGSGVVAQGTITFAGTATAKGSINLLIAAEPVIVAVEVGDAAAAVAAAVEAAIDANVNLPVTAAVAAAVVTVEAKNAGTLGNTISQAVNYFPGQSTPAGITVTFDAAYLGTAQAGSTDPDISVGGVDADTIANLLDEPYDYWISTYKDKVNVDAITDELERRSGPLVQVPGFCFWARNGSLSYLQAWTGWTSPGNSEFASGLSFHLSPEPSWKVAAVYGATCARYYNPKKPLKALELKGLLPPTNAGKFDFYERNTLLNYGWSTFTVALDGTWVLERAITNYQESPAGVDDPSYLDADTLLNLFDIRYQWRSRMLLRFNRNKIADDGTTVDAGGGVVTPKMIRNETIGLFGELEDAGYVEALSGFKESLLVERNSTDVNRVDVLMAPDITNPLYIIAGKLQFIL